MPKNQDSTTSAGGGPLATQLQRKKSLPDVQNLASTSGTSSTVREITREEISVLSSSRRDQVRRQMEEIERYKSNPLMYIINPRIQVSPWNILIALSSGIKIAVPSGSNNFWELFDEYYNIVKKNLSFFIYFQEWISRQQLMLLVLFVNLSLAFMFFKLLTWVQ